jgi:1-acyl-sn-glycerol-3-phosphate acyltransferase
MRPHGTGISARDAPLIEEQLLLEPPRSRTARLWDRATGRHEAAHLVAFYALFLLFGLVSFLWSAIAAVLVHVLPRRLGEPLGLCVIRRGFRAFFAAAEASGILQLHLVALDALPRGEPLVIAPNHPSLLDAALVMARVPGVICAAKSPLWNNLLLGGAVRLAGFVRNDSPTRLVRDAIRQVRLGRHFLIFPEGTRSSAWPVGPVKGGFALIARRAGVSVQTVFIETNSRFLGKGWPLFKRPPLPLVYRVRLGPRIAAAGDSAELVDRVRRCYHQELGAGGDDAERRGRRCTTASS